MQDDWGAFRNPVTNCATVQTYSSIHASCQRQTNETRTCNNVYIATKLFTISYGRAISGKKNR